MRLELRRAHLAAKWAQRVFCEVRRRWVAFGELWRRSLQLRVVVSTLALSSAVVFVLGIVLQTQITDRLLEAKRSAAVAQAESAANVVGHELVGINPGADTLTSRLSSALTKLTSSDSESANSVAGAFQPVLADGLASEADGQQPFAGPYAEVPPELRRFVENGQVTTQIHTVVRDSGRTTLLIIGVPVRSLTRPLQLYLLYPLAAEQGTITVVQSTLVVGGIVLLLLLGGITNLVTTQVVRPVRQAAEAAARFADGKLEERVHVIGEDDVARLGESYNRMAASIQAQIRQLEEFGHLQRRFTSDVSHELRTPLTTVRMAADVLHASREQFPSGLARSTELLVDELDRFESLLGDLLEISRLDAGVEDLAADPIDVRGIARRAVDSVSAIAGNAGSVVELDLPRDEVIAEADSRRVERILRNLLANAVDHGEGLPVQLRVAADDHAVAVTVRDHGVGLGTGEDELVFNRFWRADPSRNRRTGGTGLGLAISLEDARLHGGWLEAWGEPGCGACFRLTIPCRQGDALTSSPLPLRPPDLLSPGVDEAVAPGDLAPSQVEVAWQSADSAELGPAGRVSDGLDSTAERAESGSAGAGISAVREEAR